MFLSSVWMDGWMGFVRRDDEGMRYIYIHYIHPELRIGDCRSGSGKGAWLL